MILIKRSFQKHKGWVLEYLDEDGSKEEKISVSKDDSGEEVGNGRIAIWKDTVKLFSHKPIFWNSSRNAKSNFKWRI